MENSKDHWKIAAIEEYMNMSDLVFCSQCYSVVSKDSVADDGLCLDCVEESRL